jgi:hypothetical protein
MLSTVFSTIGGEFVDRLLGRLTGVFDAYLKKEITGEQLRAQVLEAVLATIREIEIAQADALAKTYAAFMQALAQSKLMQRVWACAVISQLVVLIWHQLGIPALAAIVHLWSPGWSYPSSGATADWAYLLVAGLLGMGPVVLRAGPAAGNLVERLKGLVAR